MLDIRFVPPALPTSGALALLVGEEGELAGLAAEADAATGGSLRRAFAAAKFVGKKGSSCTVLAPGAGLTQVVAAGLGKVVDATAAEEAGGVLAAALTSADAVLVAADGLPAGLAASVALGAALRAYRFDRYRTKEKADDKPKLAALQVAVAEAGAAETAWEPLKAVMQGVFLARDLASEPANVLTPAVMAERAQALSALGVEVEVMGPAEMAELGFGLLLGVSQGSAAEPRMVVMRWQGDPANTDAPMAFVGKGVTFDTGGVSIKGATGMEDMKWDMAGAGAVIGAMAALAGRRARANVVGLVGLVENMVSSTAQRPGDVVRSYSGQTVEVINTDAEGRLVLGDVLWYCQERFKPAFMVDLATLTGGIITALGHEYAGLFVNDEALAGRLLAAGAAVGEKLWRMPLGEAYDKMLKSEIADMKNVGGRPGGSSSAACFVQRFTNGVPWAHLDIAGTAWSAKGSATVPKGATAFGVRLLDRLVGD